MRKKLEEQIEILRLKEEIAFERILEAISAGIDEQNESLKKFWVDQMEEQEACTRKSIEMLRNSLTTEIANSRKEENSKREELRQFLRDQMEDQEDRTRKGAELLQDSLIKEIRTEREEENLKREELKSSLFDQMEAQGDCTRRSVEMLRDSFTEKLMDSRKEEDINREELRRSLFDQMEVQGDCTRRNVENIRGTVDGNMSLIRDKLDQKISLEVEVYRDKVRKSDLQPPLLAKYEGKTIVKYPCDPRYCTTCLACFYNCPTHAISRTQDEEGFYCISIDASKCIGCKKCIEACHVNTAKDILLKKPKKLFACISKNVEDRVKSSSGGIFSELAKKIIQEGGIVYGVGFDKNFDIKHMGIEHEDELDWIRGSKYVQSDVDTTFLAAKGYVEAGRKVLYSGTPCQIAALKQFIGYTPYLYTIDVVCHGVVSPKFYEDYKKRLVTEYGAIKNIYFRDKKNGWENYSIRVEFESGEIYWGKRLEEPFTKGFLEELTNRPVCHRCQYARGERVGDITLADFWGFQEKEGGILNDDMGISACMINSAKGEALFEAIRDNVISEEREYERLRECNRPLKYPSLINPDRDKFWQDYQLFGFDYVCEHWLS